MPIEIRALKRSPKPETTPETVSNVNEVTEPKKTSKRQKQVLPETTSETVSNVTEITEPKKTSKRQKQVSPENPPEQVSNITEVAEPQEIPKQQKQVPPEITPEKVNNVTEVVEHQETSQQPNQAEQTDQQTKATSKKKKKKKKRSKKPRARFKGIVTFLEIPPDFVPPTTPPELVPAEPIHLDPKGKYYQAIALLSGKVVAVDNFLHLQLPTATIKLKGTECSKDQLLSRLGTTVGVKGWISHNGAQLQILKVCEPPSENMIALAGIIKPIEEEGKTLLLIPRNAPVKTKYFNVFALSLSKPLRPRARFIRCFATFNDEGVLAVEKITASLPFLPKFVKDKQNNGNVAIQPRE
ncbi:MAG: hypothetical protein VKL20_01610 [Synechocystis sp.]|nr:hypothetical protein [Synechocystis sp.]